MSKKKESVRKEILRLAVFLIVFGILFFYISSVLEDNFARSKKGKFFTGRMGSKVLILGTSHSLYGIDPEVMDENGVPDVYNLSGYAQRMPTSYWVLNNALDYCDPEVVVVDLYSVERDDKYSVESLGFVHMTMDAIPLSKKKIQMAKDLFEDKETQKEMLFSFYLYHNRWDELKPSDFEIFRYYTKGYRGLENGCVREKKCVAAETPTYISSEKSAGVNSVGYEYLKKICDLCDKKGIKLVLTFIPHAAGEEQQAIVNGIGKMAEEKGYGFYNMLYDPEIGIDYGTDFTDKGSAHVNTTGAAKVSKALAEYLLSEGYVSLPAN